MAAISPITRRRLEIQGFVGVEERTLAETAPWLRLAFALCTVLAAAGTVLASPVFLWSLVPIAALAAAFPVHPFDLLYNYGLRYLTGTGPLPKRGAPSRFACGVGSVWIIVTGWAFQSGAIVTGRSEEHTSELQSQSNLVCRLLLEKKKQLRGHFGGRR